MEGFKQAQSRYDNMMPDDVVVCELCGCYKCRCDKDVDFEEPYVSVDEEYEPTFY